MLILQEKLENRTIQLHHLGKLNLRMYVRNPEPKMPIPNYEEDVDFGHIHFDAEFERQIEHDFYYIYESIKGKRDLIERVSFTRPVRMLSEEYGYSMLYALERGLIPYQHPIVVNYSFNQELAGCNIPTDNQDFFGWDFVKTTNKKGIRREVKDGTRHHYAFLIERGLEKEVRTFIPNQLFEPLYRWAPLYVLDVMDMLDFGLFEAVPQGYSKYFKPRLSQRLLSA